MSNPPRTWAERSWQRCRGSLRNAPPFALGFCIFAAWVLRIPQDLLATERTRPEVATLRESGAQVPDRAELSWEWALGDDEESHSRWREMASDSIPIQSEVERGNEAWVDTLSALIDPFYAADERNACAAEYAADFGEGGGCAFRMRMVVERSSANTGRVVYSRASPVTENERSTLGLGPPDAACPAYLQCLASTRLATTVPIPVASWGEVAIHQSHIAAWSEHVPPDKMPLYADMLDAERKKREAVAETPVERVKVKQLGQQAAYYRAKAARAGSDGH